MSKDKFLKEKTKKAIWNIMIPYKEKKEAAFKKIGLKESEYKNKMTEIRKKPFEDFEKNLEKAKESLENNGFKIHEAKNGQEAGSILKNIIEKSELKKIASSKTNTGREIEMDKILKGFDWTETDLGDYVVKLFKEEDQHYVLPSLHIDAKMISQKIKEVFGDEIEADAEKCTRYLSQKIREKILQTEIGISGANFFTKDGSVVLLENEGNISLISRVAQKHIVLCGIDKIVESVSDGVELSRTAAIFGTGQYSPQYVSVISGPSKTADIENKLVEGAQGAKEVEIILVDNGRRKMMQEGFKDIARCINCGSCLNFCPVYNQEGAFYGGDKYIGSKGIIFSYFQENSQKAFKNGGFDCILCRGCYENCPMKIDLPEMVNKIRNYQDKEGVQTETNKEMLENIKKDGNPFGKEANDKTPDKLYCC
ncbi:MAG: LUD domain-containing protein [Candidatus Moraniibacteriota bacterium]